MNENVAQFDPLHVRIIIDMQSNGREKREKIALK